jgi:hypothetical protein
MSVLAPAQRNSRSHADRFLSPAPAAPSGVRSLGFSAPGHQAHRLASITVAPPILQPKLVVGGVDDPAEHEAELVADRVMRMPEPMLSISRVPVSVHRKCAACEEEELSRAPTASGHADPGGTMAPSIVHDVLRTPGQRFDPAARGFFESRFGHDFSGVQIHINAQAAASAAAVKARAYTVGGNIVFAAGQYRPASPDGRRLLAHELTHVLQQRAATGQRLRSTLMRADPDAVGQITKLGTVVGAAVQFFPAQVADSVIGPVSAQGGLLSHGMSRLSVIIGQNITPRILAREILPLWTTATPFTPSGGGAPVGPGTLTEEQLAQGLLVYNRYYLRLPAMTEWRAGLHFPLPVGIDAATGIGTVNTDIIRSLAATFDPAWAPVLDQRAAATVAPPAATVQADVTAFLAAEPTPLARGVALGARAITNAQAELPVIREAFNQLGGNGFEVALAMIDELVNRDISLLAAQRDGAAILAAVRTALAAAPAAMTADQQASLARANAMMTRVAGVVAAAPSAAAPVRAEKVVTVDTVKLDGSGFTPSTQVAVANAIYAQCNVRFTHGIDATATAAQTTGWLGADRALAVAPSCGAVSAEERALYGGATTAFGLTARIRAFFASGFNGYNASGYSLPQYCATGPAAPFRGVAVIVNTGDTSALAHEIGHILLNSGAHPSGSIMQPRPRPNEITDPQCKTIYTNA